MVDDALDSDSVEIAGHEIPVVGLLDACGEAQVMVRSPGFPRYLPDLVHARDAGVPMTTPIDLFVGDLDPAQRVVMITGTKGKSTTTELIGRFAREAGLIVGVAGNLGVPVFDDGWGGDAPIIVLEVSSYQASDLHHVPDIAVVTSIAEDHLSWHGGLEQYLSDKLRIVANDGATAGHVVVPRAEHRAREVRADRFPELVPVLVDDIETDGSDPVHRVRNAALAARVVEMLGSQKISTQQIRAGAHSSMPGRLDICRSNGNDSVADDGASKGDFGAAGITFVDDALASNPSATAAGLAWARNVSDDVVVILGGQDRGVSVEPLVQEAAYWHDSADGNTETSGTLRAVTLANNGEDLAQRCGIEIIGRASSVADAVERAVEALRCGTSGRESRQMVVFSPAAPTPAGQGNWRNRSEEFREAVLKVSHP
ncbi:MAG: Mur ligase family protein [Microthrixaceae bacterium]